MGRSILSNLLPRGSCPRSSFPARQKKVLQATSMFTLLREQFVECMPAHTNTHRERLRSTNAGVTCAGAERFFG